MDTGTFASKPYLMVLHHSIPTGGYANCKYTFNNSSGNAYANRYNENNGSDATANTQPNIDMRMGEYPAPCYAVSTIVNEADTQKQIVSHNVNQNTAGAGTPPAD